MRVRLQPRSPQVVVRAGSAPAELARSSTPRRSDTPTLIGIDLREPEETRPEGVAGSENTWIWVENDWLESGGTLLAMKRRPAVIREEGDEELAEEYRREAARILASGLFGPHEA